MKILIPIPDYGFDPTETAVPWHFIRAAQHKIIFATPSGGLAEADRRMVTGADLPWFLKNSMVAQKSAVERYHQMTQTEEFRQPKSYEQVRAEEFDGLLLPGGHDKGMRPYLESKTLQKIVANFFAAGKPIGAICHGTLLAARSQSAEKKSVLWGRKTTGLTYNQEMVAYLLTRYKLGDYYRTYSTPMNTELVSFLKSPSDYSPGPSWPLPMGRDSDQNLKPGFTVLDKNYLSARWPGDAHRFGMEFVKLLSGSSSDAGR